MISRVFLIRKTDRERVPDFRERIDEIVGEKWRKMTPFPKAPDYANLFVGGRTLHNSKDLETNSNF